MITEERCCVIITSAHTYILPSLQLITIDLGQICAHNEVSNVTFALQTQTHSIEKT